ncbi:hypothetical protein D3C81_2219920 [compost metagenome]
MQANPLLAAVGRDRLKLREGRQLAADLPLREFQQQTSDLALDGLHIRQRNQLVRLYR